MTRRMVVAATVALCVAGGVPQAHARTYPVAFQRAVAYWYLPTDESDVHRLYRVEVVRVEDLVTGEVDARASVVTDRCTERWVSENQFFLACGDGRRERVTRRADLVVSPDASSGTATFEIGGRRHVVRFQGHASPQQGVFERDLACSATDQTLVAGHFANMNASGRVLGKRLDRPYRPDLDHAWLESGAGTWCDEER